MWKISNYRPFGIIERDPNESTYEVGDDKFPIIVDVRGSFQEQQERAAKIVHAVNSLATNSARIAELEANEWAIRRLFDLPPDGDLFDQLREHLEHEDVGQVRLQNCVSNLLAEPIYEQKEKPNGIAVRFLMRLHLLAHEVRLEQYGKDNPVVAEALAALGDPASNSPESLAAARTALAEGE